MSETILEEAQRHIYGDRNEAYGHPLEDFERTVGMINSLFAHKLREPFIAEDWPLMMECCKASREVNQPKRDNAVDGAGYWGTLQMVKDERERRAKEAEADMNDALHTWQEPDLDHCPNCGGPADNGHDRAVPPSPYFCTKCHWPENIRVPDCSHFA